MNQEKELLERVKDKIALSYTGGNHNWNDGYLNKTIKLILMNDVARAYANELLKLRLGEVKDCVDKIPNNNPAFEGLVKLKKLIDKTLKELDQ